MAFGGQLSGLLVARGIGFQEVVELGEERLALNAVDHAGFLYGFAPGRGAAQAMHADGEEQRRTLGRDIQNVSDNGVLFNVSRRASSLPVREESINC